MQRLKYKKQNYYIIIPISITYLNMCLGVVAIFVSSKGTISHLKSGCLLVLLAAITDKLDGFVARKLDLASELGKQLDSLSDLVSFGIAPVFIGWTMKMYELSFIEILLSIVFIGAGVFRLARFNIMKDEGYIVGLPITLAGAILVAKYFLNLHFGYDVFHSSFMIYSNMVLLILLSFLMISKISIKVR